ncbi:MAG: Methylase involved in ubiquinone/menaquinone biosynthesis [candidate division Zixibacteria bacterium RBG-1]|nr:MAG: Methylase involved in ubiquinone/menaquinone biosynthesis [candidate division Zixibacteria bacterium RBG-1]OGC84786.1 MAG: hypothetical protein A2V73_05695 [candidate division Zixibacteria bacterium RBG_19FT_COMBO_42_43]
MNTDVVKYYALRAKEYEKIYYRPERQAEIFQLCEFLKEEFRNLNLLEIACGTGYWTQVISETAKSIVATDINPEMLEIAQGKKYPASNVRFKVSDIFKMDNLDGEFEAGFGGYIWSHIPIQDLPQFLNEFQQKIKKGGKVIFIDNNHLPDYSTAIVKQDEYGNGYQKRNLEDGTAHLVLINYPDKEFIESALSGVGKNIKYQKLKFYWTISYETI